MLAPWKLLSFIVAVLWATTPAPSTAPHPSPTFPPHGGAFVTSLPGSASAWLDGSFVGPTPVYVDDLLPGRHTLTLSRAGWQPQSASFDISVGRITPVSVIMQRVSSQAVSQSTKGQGTLVVAGGAPGAKVYVDGVVIGTFPVEPKTVEAGYHIVTLEPPGKNPVKSTRVVNVFPNVTTAVAFSEAASVSAQPPPDDILEPIDSVVPINGVVVAGNDVTIHYRGIEVECEIGSRTYTLNGRAGTLAVSPALVGGKVYLPLSLLQRIAGK
jgi:copper amine oxidase-like protein/PEGA domain-containing protein